MPHSAVFSANRAQPGCTNEPGTASENAEVAGRAARALSGAIMLVAASVPAFSQSPVPVFEVASVKAVHDTRTGTIRQVNTERYRSQTNVLQLLTWAWNVKNFRISGAPAWLTQERFEIQATTGRPSSKDRVRLMVQGLLADRFTLKIHRENREIPVYAIVVGKNGPG